MIDPLTAELVGCRRRQTLAAAIDAATIALVASAAAHGAMALAGLPTIWIWPAGLVAVCAATIARRYTVLNVAHTLDAAGQTGDLISSAWLVGDQSAEPWAAVLYVQALMKSRTLVADKNWHGLPSRLRSTLLLTAAALLAVTALLKPAADAARVAAVRDSLAASASSGAAQTPAWVAPQQVAHANDDPDENGRPISGESEMSARRGGDDTAGRGRADVTHAASFNSVAERDSAAPAPPASDTQGPGNGAASHRHSSGSDRQSGHGIVDADAHHAPSESPIAGTITPHGGDRTGLAVAPVYRDIVRAYFAR